jgi:tRNA pseudouridine55 synthase
MNNTFCGILLVNKSKNKTSFSIVSQLRKTTKIKKIGHCGTLDPFATGLMVMLIGKAYTTRSNDFINHDKQYIAKICLGYTTRSFDTEEEKIFFSDKVPEKKEVEEIIKNYQGQIAQIPPMFSAKKVNGKKLYELARQGKEIERKPVLVTVNIQILSYSYPYLDISVTCSKGTYIRSLANDIGKDLNTGGYLESLIRIKSGPFNIKNAVDQNEIKEGFDISKHLIK